MNKTVYALFLIIVVTVGMAGCSMTNHLQDHSESSSVSVIPDAPSISQADPTTGPDIESDASSADVLTEPSTEVEDPKLPTNEDLYHEINKVILQYQNGEITPNERFGILPKDFIFPDSWEMDDLDISRREVMGDYRAVLISSDSKYEMALISNNFTYVTGDGTFSSGDIFVTNVEFIIS